MSRRPLIGVPTQTLHTLGAVSGNMPASWVMSQRYINVLASVGGVPIMVPLVQDVETMRAIYDQLDGVFLPGGADVDPESYGAVRHPKTEQTDASRDVVELSFTRWAMEEGKPVLGVCRGLQVMNLAAGGTLYQDIADERPDAIKHDYFPFDGKYGRDHLAHRIELPATSWLAEILDTIVAPVNSMHHQGVRDLGPGLTATALAPDGLVEALEGPGDRFFLGVQWHPEALVDKDIAMRRMFEVFMEEAAAFCESRTDDAVIGSVGEVRVVA